MSLLPTETRFEDDVKINEPVFQEACKKQICKIEYFYGPYKREEKNDFFGNIRDDIPAHNLHDLLSTD